MRALNWDDAGCQRALEWVSLRLDGEASQLELRLLDAHLDECESCRSVARELEATTAAVRTASPVPLERPVVMPRRSRAVRRSLQAGMAAAAAVAAVSAGALFGLSGAWQSRPARAKAHAVPRRAEIALADKIRVAPNAGFDTGYRPELKRPWRGIYPADV
jgi:ferric-dicitrate binding protein FerR (iron transport regulator)